MIFVKAYKNSDKPLKTQPYFFLAKLDLEADMNNYIPLETAAIFFSSETFSKTGYSLGVCHG